MFNIVAKDIMNKNVITVSDQQSLVEVSNLFAEKMISGAPVVDEKGKLIGVISLSDIVQSSVRNCSPLEKEDKSAYYNSSWGDQLSEEDLEGLHLEVESDLCVQDVMTPITICVPEETKISEMADIMIGARIHRLLVTQDGEISGIVTTMDMLKIIRDWSKNQESA